MSQQGYGKNLKRSRPCLKHLPRHALCVLDCAGPPALSWVPQPCGKLQRTGAIQDAPHSLARCVPTALQGFQTCPSPRSADHLPHSQSFIARSAQQEAIPQAPHPPSRSSTTHRTLCSTGFSRNQEPRAPPTPRVPRSSTALSPAPAHAHVRARGHAHAPRETASLSQTPVPAPRTNIRRK
jgi:hypothetical protein